MTKDVSWSEHQGIIKDGLLGYKLGSELKWEVLLLTSSALGRDTGLVNPSCDFGILSRLSLSFLPSRSDLGIGATTNGRRLPNNTCWMTGNLANTCHIQLESYCVD